MEKLNLKKKENNTFGIPLALDQELFIKKNLESIRDKSPSTARVKLKLKYLKSNIYGTLQIDNLYESFTANAKTSDPIKTFLLLKQDIEKQINRWKKNWK